MSEAPKGLDKCSMQDFWPMVKGLRDMLERWNNAGEFADLRPKSRRATILTNQLVLNSAEIVAQFDDIFSRKDIINGHTVYDTKEVSECCEGELKEGNCGDCGKKCESLFIQI